MPSSSGSICAALSASASASGNRPRAARAMARPHATRPAPRYLRRSRCTAARPLRTPQGHLRRARARTAPRRPVPWAGLGNLGPRPLTLARLGRGAAFCAPRSTLARDAQRRRDTPLRQAAPQTLASSCLPASPAAPVLEFFALDGRPQDTLHVAGHRASAAAGPASEVMRTPSRAGRGLTWAPRSPSRPSRSVWEGRLYPAAHAHVPPASWGRSHCTERELRS